MPSISVIVPIFNAETCIRSSLDSILFQSFTDWEGILVDDGSFDGSSQICDEYVAKDSRFKVIHKENGGVSSAREVGLMNSFGEFVIHMDADDWVEPTMLQELYDEAIKKNADMVICDFFEKWWWGETVQRQKPDSLRHDSVLRELYGPLHGGSWNKLVRRSLLKDYDIHYPVGMNFCEDLYVNTALLKHDITVTYLPRAFYHYDHTANPTSIVNDRRRAMYRAVIKVEGLRPLLEEDFPDIFEKIQFYAKRRYLESGSSYQSFLRLYSGINNKVVQLEKLYSEDKVMSFAMRNCLNYRIAYLWGRFKDLCFVLRHLSLNNQRKYILE